GGELGMGMGGGGRRQKKNKTWTKNSPACKYDTQINVGTPERKMSRRLSLSKPSSIETSRTGAGSIKAHITASTAQLVWSRNLLGDIESCTEVGRWSCSSPTIAAARAEKWWAMAL